MAHEIRLRPAQMQFFQAEPDVTFDIAVYQGGYGSGKTFCGALLGLWLSEKNPPGTTGMVVAKTFPQVRDTTMVAYFEHMDNMGLERGKHYTYHKGEARLVFHCWGENEIIFRHLENPEKLKSLNLAWVQAEECSNITEADFQMLLSRLRQPVPVLRFFGHTNPQPAKGWIWKYLVEKAGKTSEEQAGKTAVIHRRRVMASTLDNAKNLPPGYIQNMRETYDADYYRINVLGEDGDYTKGLVIKGFSSENVREFDFDPRRRLHLSCDFNVDPMMWVVAQVIDGVYYILDEIVEEGGALVETTADIFCARWGEQAKQADGLTINGDASGHNRNVMAAAPEKEGYKPAPTAFNILANRIQVKAGVPAQIATPSANPSIIDRVNVFNSKVCNADGRVSLYIHPQCKHLLMNMRELKFREGTSEIWAPTAREVMRDPKLKFLGHIFDAVSYLTWQYSPVRRESIVKPQPQPDFVWFDQ